MSLEEFVSTFQHRLSQIGYRLQNSRESEVTLGSYNVASFELKEGKITWVLVLSNLHLELERRKLKIDEVVVTFRYPLGGRLTVQAVEPGTITGDIDLIAPPDVFGKKVGKKVEEAVKAIIDASGGKP